MLDGNRLHGVCLAQSVSVRAMNAAAIGGAAAVDPARPRFYLTPRRGLILCLGSAAAPDRFCAAAIAR